MKLQSRVGEMPLKGFPFKDKMTRKGEWMLLPTAALARPGGREDSIQSSC